MKKYLLYIKLLALLAIAGAFPSMAQKKYRYIKRQHGVKFQGNIPISVAPFNLSAEFQGAYAFNWKGLLEGGPYFELALGASPQFSLNSWAVGLMGDYNIIKNRGKRKLIPAVGLQLGLMSSEELEGLRAMGGAHGSLKWFVAKRTAFITSLQYDLVTPVSGFFTALNHEIDLSMGFSYYFDFY